MTTETTKQAGQPSGKMCRDAKHGNAGCNGRLLWRDSKFAKGEFFQGCENFPNCRGKIAASRGAPKVKAEQEKQKQKIEAPTETPAGECAVVGCGQTARFGTYYCLTHQATPAEETQKETPAMPATSTATPDLSGAIFGALAPFIQAEAAKIAHEIATKVCAESGAGKGPVVINYQVNEKEFATVDGVSNVKVVNEIMFLIACRKAAKRPCNILLVGPAGSGKTTIAAQIATALKTPFASVSCTAGMPEWHLMGRSTPNLQTGENVYAPSQFVQLYEAGGVFLIDEIDAADSNVLIAMNSALANGHWDIPGRGTVKRHAEFVCIAAANTFGMGANRQYVGRNQLDASTRSRFACQTIEVDYDRDLEKQLVGDARLLAEVWAIRERVQKLGIRQIVGTRELVALNDQVRGGRSIPDALNTLFVGWTADEISKAKDA